MKTYNDLAVDPVTILGRQEGNNASNVDGLTDTVAGRPGGGVLVDLVVVHLVSTGDVLLAHSVVHVGLDSTGGNAVDSDLLVTAVDGHAADEGLNGTLGARVDGVLGDTLGLTSDGAHHDDPAANLHVLVGLTGHEELTAGVDPEDAVELLLGNILQVAERDNTRVGAADVELAKVLDGLLHQLGGLVDVGNVGLDGNGVGAILLDLIDDGLRGFAAVGVVDDNLCATAGELEGHLLANATACLWLAYLPSHTVNITTDRNQ